MPGIEERGKRQIRIEPVLYANGWVAVVEIDGVVVQDENDAPALRVTREEALAQGEKRAQEFLEQRH